MDVVVTKSPIPIIWLDTSAIISFKRLLKKEALKPIERTRARKLFDTIIHKSQKGMVICPEAGQQEEYDFGNDAADCHRVLATLSRNVRFAFRTEIQIAQLLKVARAHKDKEDTANLSYLEAFEGSPGRLPKGNDPIVSVHWRAAQEVIDRLTRDKRVLEHALELLRQQNIADGTSFEKRLLIEYDYLSQAVKLIGDKWLAMANAGIEPTPDDVLQFAGTMETFQALHEALQTPEAVAEFLGSDDYKSTPYVQIICHLWADIVTSPKPVQPGDAMDVEHIGTVLPYSNLVVTDGKMKERINRFGFDKKYRVKVYSMGDFDALVADLERV